MSNPNESPIKSTIVGGRRSSLKNQDMKIDPKLNKKKRNSVSWGQSNTFQFKAMKALFQETSDLKFKPKEEEHKHQKFVENRKKSIKNEFALVKELMAKNKNISEEEYDEQNDEVKKNTNKNIEMGHDALNLEDSCSSSSSVEKREN